MVKSQETGTATTLQEEKNCLVIIQMDTDREYLLNGMKMGRKKSVINYSYDIVDGKMTVYYDTGAIFYEGNMNDKDGSVKGYDQNGTLRFEGKLEKGKKVGNWKYYDEMGNLIR